MADEQTDLAPPAADEPSSSPPPAEQADAAPTAERKDEAKQPDKSEKKDKKRRDAQHVIVDKRHGFFRRWLQRIAALALFLLLLAGVAFAGISMTLQSSLPKDIAQGIATSIAGLDIEIGDLDIGWGGTIDLRDIAVRLPGEDGSPGDLVVDVPRATAKIPPLPLTGLQIALGGAPQPSNVSVENPTVYMTQDLSGNWTLPQAADLLLGSLASGGSSSPDAGPSAISLPPLPDIGLTDGTVIVRNNVGDEQTLEGLTVDARELSPLIYFAEVEAPGVVELDARLTPLNGRTQVANVVTGPRLRELASPYLALPEVTGDLTWNGTFTNDGGIRGTLSFHDGTSALGIGARGNLDVATTPEGSLTLSPAVADDDDPERLRLVDVPGVEGGVHVVAGTIEVTPETAYVRGLIVDLLDGNVLVDEAAYSLDNQTATARVGFQGLQPAGAATLTGDLTADLWYGRFGEPRAVVTIEAAGEAAGRSFDQASVRVDVGGYDYRDFQTLDVSIGLPKGVLTRGAGGAVQDDLPLPPMQADVQVRLDASREGVEDPHVRLASLRSVGGSGMLDAEGVYFLPQPDSPDEAKRAANYGLWLEASGWPVRVPRVDEPLPLSFGTLVKGRVAEGEVKPVELASLYAQYGDIDIWGSGWYLPDVEGGGGGGSASETPSLSVNLTAMRREGDGNDPPPEDELAEDAFAVDPGNAGRAPTSGMADDTPQLAGDLTMYLSVWGDPIAKDLVAEGRLDAARFALGPYELGDAAAGFEARVTAEQLTFDTTDVDVFDASMAIAATVPWDETQAGQVGVNIDELSIGRLCEAMGIEIGGEPATGTVGVELAATLNGLSPDTISASGTVQVVDLATAFAPVADTITLKPMFQNGVVELPIEVRRATPPGLAGMDDPAFALSATPPEAATNPATDVANEQTISLTAHYALSDPMRVEVRELRADGYPITLEPDVLGDTVAAAATLRLDSDVLELVMVETPPDDDDSESASQAETNDAGDEANFETPLRVRGDLEAGLALLTGPNPFDLETFVDTRLALRADGSRITLDELRGELPNVGVLSGGGTFELADVPGRSNLWVRVSAELGPLAERIRLPEGGEGSLDVALNVRPAPGERPKGEVLVDLAFNGRDARWRTVDIDRGQIIAYLSRVARPDGTPPAGAYDFTVASTERLRIFAAGGRLEGYAKYRDRRVPGVDGLLDGDQFAQVTLDGQGFDVAQLGPVVGRDNAEGRLAFDFDVFGPLAIDNGLRGTRLGEDGEADAGFARFNGGGSIRIRDGRLANVDFFRVILEAAKLLRLPARDEVDADFRLDNGTFFVSGGRAFVDGIEIRGNVRVGNALGEGYQPLSGQAVVLAKPLETFNIPLVGDIAQEILDAFQANATGIELYGSVDSPRARPAVLSDVGETLGALLGR